MRPQTELDKKMAIESTPFGTTKLTGEDARAFRYSTDYAEITTGLLGAMASAVEPEVWESDNIINRLRSLKRAEEWFRAMMAVDGYQDVIDRVRTLENGAATKRQPRERPKDDPLRM